MNSDRMFKWHKSAVVFDANRRIDYDGLQNVALEFSADSNHVSSPADAFVRFFAGLQSGFEPCLKSDSLDIYKSENSSDDFVFRCLSSGTLGKSVQIRRTHNSWINSFHTNSRMWNISPQDQYGILGELSYSLSLYAATEAVNLGADLHLLSELTPLSQFKELDRREVSILYSTPSQINLIHSVAFRNSGLQSKAVRLLLIGGSKMHSKHLNAASDLFPNAEIWEFYGTSETSFIALGNKNKSIQDVGKAYPSVKISIDSESKNVGLIRVESPYTALGYVSGSKGSARWEGKAVVTSDLGQVCPDGHLMVFGRKDRRMKIADKLVCPEEIESCILKVDSIDHAAVLPLKDNLRGSIPVAFIKTSNGASRVGLVLKSCQQQLAAFKRPKRIVELHQWPVMKSGKTDYDALQRLLHELS